MADPTPKLLRNAAARNGWRGLHTARAEFSTDVRDLLPVLTEILVRLAELERMNPTTEVEGLDYAPPAEPQWTAGDTPASTGSLDGTTEGAEGG